MLIVTIMLEIKTVVKEKHRFDNRHESFLKENFLEILDYQDFDTRININGFLHSNPFLQEWDLLLGSLIDELKPVVAEKIQSE